ncbi:MAG: hypothetical protein WC140_02990 [Bacteroidales bacterium]
MLNNKSSILNILFVMLLSMISLTATSQVLKSNTSNDVIIENSLSTYSPFSMFGIGELQTPGTAYNLSMGGIGIAVQDKRFINYLNPAAIHVRDTLAFMMDFGGMQKNIYSNDGTNTSAYNVANMNNVAVSFPLFKKSAFVIGIAPFANTGYLFYRDEESSDVIADMGQVQYRKYGTGSINKLFLGVSAELFTNFSLGVEGIYYFGEIKRHSDIMFNSVESNKNIYTGWDYQINSFSAKLGAQYVLKLKNEKLLTFGATYRLGNNLSGNIQRYAYTSNTSSTNYIINEEYDDKKIEIASDLGLGVTYAKYEKWLLGVDYNFQNWKNTKFASTPGINFKPVNLQSLKLGGSYTPNMYDIRYYMKRVTYRFGAYYKQSYINLNGSQINDFGITLGASLPIYRWYNSFTIGLDIGQRGMMTDQLLRERYIKIMIDVNLHDIWFRKFQYN